MNILIIDQDNLQTKTRRTLIEDRVKESTTELAQNLKEVHLKYKKDAFDLVIMDHTVENGEECFRHIIQSDPQQQVLVVSNAVKCVLPRCGDCVENHQIRRLSNPTPIPNILRMVDGFEHYECPHYDPQTNLIDA